MAAQFHPHGASAIRRDRPAPRDAGPSSAIAAGIGLLERDARSRRGWLPVLSPAPDAAIRHAEALARDAADADEPTLACLSLALARSLRRGGGQAALASYVTALNEAVAIGPPANGAPAREAMAAMVAQRLGG